MRGRRIVGGRATKAEQFLKGIHIALVGAQDALDPLRDGLDKFGAIVECVNEPESLPNCPAGKFNLLVYMSVSAKLMKETLGKKIIDNFRKNNPDSQVIVVSSEVNAFRGLNKNGVLTIDLTLDADCLADKIIAKMLESAMIPRFCAIRARTYLAEQGIAR